MLDPYYVDDLPSNSEVEDLRAREADIPEIVDMCDRALDGDLYALRYVGGRIMELRSGL